MLSTSFGPFLYISAVVLAGGFFGHWLIRRGRTRTLIMLAVAHVFAAVGLYSAAQSAGGAPMAMTYLLFLFLLILPSLVGVILGAVVGWWRGPKARQG